jgi:DNA topoisomerase VI subunit A
MAQAPRKTSGAVEKKLVGVADAVIVSAERSRDPTLAIPVRSLANVTFNEKRGIIELGKRKQARSFFNAGMAKKFMQTVLVADALAELQRANLTTSLREIYYRTKHTMRGSHENTFDGQNESDPLIEDLEVALAALREELHVRAENAGSVVGPLVLGDDGDRVDCARLGKGGYSVPSIVEPEYIEIRRCTADFVLLVEKGTQWNRLSEDKFWRRYNCVLLTGNGQPPRGVRRLARRLHEDYKLPVYVLVDNDPWGCRSRANPHTPTLSASGTAWSANKKPTISVTAWRHERGCSFRYWSNRSALVRVHARFRSFDPVRRYPDTVATAQHRPTIAGCLGGVLAYAGTRVKGLEPWGNRYP